MPLEILDVIDTAVKVGLGAVISGVATYQVTHLNHRSDKNKELIKRKVEIITLSIEKVEIYFAAFSRCQQRLLGILHSGTPPRKFPDDKLKLYRELDDVLVKSWENRAIASSRLQLIGQVEAAKLIGKSNSIERKLRDKVIFEKELPSEKELNEISQEMYALKKSIYVLLAAAFERVYG